MDFDLIDFDGELVEDNSILSDAEILLSPSERDASDFQDELQSIDDAEDSDPFEEIPLERRDDKYETGRQAALSKIRAIFHEQRNALLNGDDFSIRLKSRSIGNTRPGETITCRPRIRTRRVQFPGCSENESWRFTVLLKILNIVYNTLLNNRTITKRDIYYMDVPLFRKQAIVDSFVDDIAFTFGLSRINLNVLASAKGLIAGSIKFRTVDGEESVDCSAEKTGVLVPNWNDIVEFSLMGADWILVIEKEATFRSLATNGFAYKNDSSKGIIITGKGYPDMQTRKFLFELLERSNIPTYILTDLDPHGLEIKSVYQNGSARLAHESEHLAIVRARWLGVRHLDSAYFSNSSLEGIKLTAGDRKKAFKMLTRTNIGEMEKDALRWMLYTNTKLEIEEIGTGGYLEKWLEDRLFEEQLPFED